MFRANAYVRRTDDGRNTVERRIACCASNALRDSLRSKVFALAHCPGDRTSSPRFDSNVAEHVNRSAMTSREYVFGDTISGFERRRERDGGGGSSGGWVHNTTGVGRTNDDFGGKLSIGETDATVHETIRDYGPRPRTGSNVARRRREVNERRISRVVRKFGVLSAFFLFFGRPFARSNEPGAPDRQKAKTFPLLLS